ncbi:unnamed protein product [Parnassius apollo]|uniref:(apollo) hypothetical protein n=1 Tax=Parnassius apollo TaxID=110799 RepID=A0A8S3X4C4_PARAO|nr:unnamed protein product [Parnassius apollo]
MRKHTSTTFFQRSFYVTRAISGLRSIINREYKEDGKTVKDLYKYFVNAQNDNGKEAGLSDADIESALFNFDESDFEDVDDEEEENFSTVHEDIPEEVLPRSPDGSEWNSSDKEPLVSLQRVRISINLKLRWDRTNNNQNSSRNINEAPPLVEPTICKPSYEYFCHYIKPDFFEQMSHCTNICSIHRAGRYLNINLEEMRTFVGVSMVMGMLGIPRMRTFWTAETRAALVANAITRNRYFQLRSNIKVVDDQLVSSSMKTIDRFWKIRPLVSTIYAGCTQN